MLVPTEYVGTRPSPQLEALATGVPDDVPIAWTGRAVVNDAITVADAGARAASLGGRRPLLWDNYPVNDAIMGDRLFVGPLRGGRRAWRRPATATWPTRWSRPARPCCPSRRSPRSCAATIRRRCGGRRRPTSAGSPSPCACDTDEARDAVAAVAAGDPAPARALFTTRPPCAAPGLEDEAGRWLTQVHRDARLALQALDVLDGERAIDVVLGMAARWQASRRATVTVFGPRCSIRPVLGQADDGTWQVEPEAVQHDQNAIDDLVRLALATL